MCDDLQVGSRVRPIQIQYLARSFTENGMTIVSMDPFNCKGLLFQCITQGHTSTLLIPLHWGWDWTALVCPIGEVLSAYSHCSAVLAATLTSGELSPSWRAPCRGPAVAVPPVPAPLALSPAPKEALSPDHKQGPVNGPGFEVKLSLPSP